MGFPTSVPLLKARASVPAPGRHRAPGPMFTRRDIQGHRGDTFSGQGARVRPEPDPFTCRWLGTAGTALIAVGGVAAGALSVVDPYAQLPLVRELHAVPGLAVGVVYAGLVLLVSAWLRLGAALPRPRDLAVTLACWCAPLLLAPPMFSRDAYSYLAQGAMVRDGLDPYVFGPAVLGGVASLDVPPIWQYTPAPYGPVFLALAAVADTFTDGYGLAGVVAVRIVALAGVALMVRFVPILARRTGVDPSGALWLGVLNPLVIVHLVAGMHNDALMVGLMVTGLVLVLRGRATRGAVALTLAALVKAPAGLALLFAVPLLAGRDAGPPGSRREQGPPAAGRVPDPPGAGGESGPPAAVRESGRSRAGRVAERLRAGRGAGARVLVRTAARLGLVGVVTTVAVTEFTGLGYGWIGALRTPAVVHNGLSLSTDLGYAFGWLPHVLGVADFERSIEAARVVGFAAVVVTVGRALRRKPPVAGLGIALCAVVVFGPVVHPWYLIWGTVPLAAGTADRRMLRPAILVSAVLTFLLQPMGDSPGPAQVVGAFVGAGLALASLRPAGLLPALLRGDVPKREVVALDAETADHAAGDRGDHRVVPELLPGVDVGDVHLDQRPAQQRTGVA
ncbi:hypothetical protein Val02_46820 [Virgisporangium aliadipatigenens]|uniref:DUF2029 domain-containing protein n=1 Tax=Virgisporangium aliadipatigenens TaxID=741659 RepID=A0A8J3YQ12_9ACTN|nr:hypothetical protein Val02_46820 [Virgisporangium aliadipatigenens]